MFQAGSDIERRIIFKKRKQEVPLFPLPPPAAECEPPARRDTNKASNKISLITYIDL